MFSNFLDLEQPEELYLNEAMAAYIQMDLDRDDVLLHIRRDFPLMDNFYMRKAELALFEHFKEQYRGEADIKADWIRIFSPEFSNEPENFWRKTIFYRERHKELTAALHFTNMSYASKSVKETFGFYACDSNNRNEIHIGDISIEMDKNELCRTEFVQLPIATLIPAGQYTDTVNFTLRRKQEVAATCPIDYSTISSCGKLTITRWNFFSETDSEPVNSFNIQDTSYISGEIWLEANCRDKQGNRVKRIEADLVIGCSNQYRNIFVNNIIFEHSGGSIYKCKQGIVRLDDNVNTDLLNLIPRYNWGMGTFEAHISIWGNIVAERKINFYDRPVKRQENDEVQKLIEEMALTEVDTQNPGYFTKQDTSDSAYAKLMAMAGLESVKEAIISKSAAAEFARKRRAAGLPTAPINLHSCFLGGPGTGKTTVARLIGRIYKENGLLSSGHLVEESRQTLVGMYSNTEAETVAEAVAKAEGGILLIDDAHNLFVQDDNKDQGRMILEYLKAEISNKDKNDWMLILAGPEEEMTKLLNHNKSLQSHISNKFYFKDYNEEELMNIADLYCDEGKFILSEDARAQLREVIRRDLSHKDETFGNGTYVKELMDRIVNINMAARVGRIQSDDAQMLQRIEACDIPVIRQLGRSRNLDSLKELIGLEPIKQSIESHIQYVRMLNRRTQMGLDSSLPPLHMIFTGNPGTGKTTVAELLGEIYASMGILSRGEVIYVERRNLMGAYIGHTERALNDLLKRAKGNILFIDEAYQLYKKDDDKDFGKIVIEGLLTTLSKGASDLIVILAGYSKEMEEMINMNTGIESRFPYRFHFDDYSVDELVSIAHHIANKQNYRFSEDAISRLRDITKREIEKNKESFGNARFIKNLINNKILPAMAHRTAKLDNPTIDDLSIITDEDVYLGHKGFGGLGFDEQAIAEALERLDNLVGQNKVKAAVHNFVDVARYLNDKGERFTGKGILKWNFVGNTGTGKSTVARIMAEILKAMNILASSEITEVKGEEIFNIPEYQCNEVLVNAIRKSRNGLLLIDGDSPECRNSYNYMTGGQLRAKLAALTAENEGAGAIVLAEISSPVQSIATNLALNGVYDYDHTFIFDDYTEEELYRILCHCLKKYKMNFSPEAEVIIRQYINDLSSSRDRDIANARTMKLLARTIQQIVILRLSGSDCGERTITAEDVESFVWKKMSSKIGF